MKQRLRFGDAVSLGRVASRGKLAFVVPTFGAHCVCCNAETMGRTQDFDPSTDRIRAEPIKMPVCFACKEHALQTPFAPMMQAVGLLLGIAITALGGMYAADRPGDGFLKWMMIVGVALIVVSIAWIRASSRKQARANVGGHHPGLALSLVTGATLVDTENETLVEELLQLNASARRLPTPLFWRLRGEGLPKAKVVGRRD